MKQSFERRKASPLQRLDQFGGRSAVLGVLLCQVEASRPIEGEPGFDYEQCWMHFKEPIANLVGWHRRHGDERLRTTHAYEIAYFTLWQALHD
jgi:hypothetical protein